MNKKFKIFAAFFLMSVLFVSTINLSTVEEAEAKDEFIGDPCPIIHGHYASFPYIFQCNGIGSQYCRPPNC
jgi:hypothetical protein